MKRTPDARLSAAAALVRTGAVFADVGTDHAYLPLLLLEDGKIARAYACDIGEGPLARARAHVAASPYADRVTLLLTDGLEGLDGRGITDIALCGMGGELIVRILSRAPWVRDPALRLILQPMTRAAVLRRYLAAEGFSVEEERLSRAAGRAYTCIAAHYDGIKKDMSPEYYEMGDLPKDPDGRAIYRDILLRKTAALRKKIAGRASADRAEAADDALLSAYENLLRKVDTV